MEKPDANGYVNITWPSKTIPHGGIFHTKVVEPTAAQQEFLKGLLFIACIKNMSEYILFKILKINGHILYFLVLLEESKLTIAQRQKNAFALRQEETKVETKPRLQAPLIRPRTSRRRSLSAIRESEALNVDQYVKKYLTKLGE